MGLHIGGNGVAGLRFGGRDAAEAKLNGLVVWPDTPPGPVDPWPTKPCLLLANGERVQVLAGTYDPVPQYEPGGRVLIGAGEECSLLYPDTRSPGPNLRYDFQSGAYITYTAGDAFRIYDRNGVLLEPIETLPDAPGTYNLCLFYAYAGDTLLMGLWYSTATYMTVDRRASGGIPGAGTTRRADTYYGITEEYIGKLHDIALALTGGDS